MARILSPPLLLLLLFACSGPKGATQPHVPSSQETYEYGVCPKNRDDGPRERTLACALEAIASRYYACSKHEDCVASKLDPKCSEAGSCPPLFVNREMKAGFEAEAQREVDRYCENSNCKSSGLCLVTKFEARCASSHCTWRTAIDPFENPPH